MVAKLTILEGPLKGLVLALEKRQEWVIGRDPQSCHVVVEDQAIDRKQLLVRVLDEGFSVENLSNTVEVLLNEESLTQPTMLFANDRLKIGQTVFEFSDDEGEDLFELESISSADNLNEQDDQPDAESNQQEENIEELAPELNVSFEEAGSSLEENAQNTGLEQQESNSPDNQKPEVVSPQIQNEESGRIIEPSDSVVSLEASEEEDSPQSQEDLLFSEHQEEGSLNEGDQENAEESEIEDKVSKQEVVAGDHSEVLNNELQEDELVLEAQESSDDEIEEEFTFEAQESVPQDSEKSVEALIGSEEFEERASFSAEEEHEEPIFKVPDQEEDLEIDLSPSVRFVLKVISGPNAGAEFALHEGEHYLIGTDTTSCDIVLHDLSISREHARLILSSSGELSIKDLKSRNGVLIDQKPVENLAPFAPNSVIALGTTSFFILDKEAPQETIIAPSFDSFDKYAPSAGGEISQEGVSNEEVPQGTSEKKKNLFDEAANEEKKKEDLVAAKSKAPDGSNIFATIVAGLAIVIVLGILSLWNVKEVSPPPSDYLTEIQTSVQNFPAVKFTYNKATRRLFLIGHVSTGIEKNELLYNLGALNFLKGIEDHVVNDEAIWQEMNILLSKDEGFKGISMHSPKPGTFVLQGYLKTEKQAARLTDYMNIQFNFLDRLENRVIVEEQMQQMVASQLIQGGFGSVVVSFLNGELVLAGYVGANQQDKFTHLIEELKSLPGVRQLQNFVVIVSPEQQVIDLNLRFPGKYQVTGFSKQGDVNINVVVNGTILSRGDTLDGMTVTSLQPHLIFLEKDGLKYKLEYNK